MAKKSKNVEKIEQELVKAYAAKITLRMKMSAEGESARGLKAMEDLDGNIETLKELYLDAHNFPVEESRILRLAGQLIIQTTGHSPSELINLLQDDKVEQTTVGRTPAGKRIFPVYGKAKVNTSESTTESVVVTEAEIVSEVYASATSATSATVEINTDVEKMTTLAMSCKQDFIFFCKTCLEIPYRPGLNPGFPNGGYGPFVPNDSQMKIVAPLISLWIDKKPVRAIILKSRQMGITTVLLAFWLWMIVQKKYFTVMFIIDKDAHMMEKRDTIIRWAKLIADRVPDLPTIQSQGSKVIRWTNNAKILFESSQSPNPGTSEMINALHCSEKPKWVRGKDVIIDRSILPGISDDSNTFIVDESTADGVNGFYRKWLRVTTGREQGASRTLPLFLPWYLSEEYRKKAPKDFQFHNDDPELSEFDEEGALMHTEQQYAEKYLLSKSQIYWRRLKIKNDFKGDREAFDKEYPTTPAHAWRSNGSLFFGTDTLVQVEKNLKDPIFVGRIADANGNNDPSRLYSYTMYRPSIITDRNGNFKVYELPELEEEYLIGGDVAEGIEADPEKGGDPDYTFFVVTKKSTGRVVATYIDRVKPEDAAHPLILIGLFYRMAKINVERNTVGQTVWAMFKQTGYGKIYVRTGNGPYEDRAWNKVTKSNRKPMLIQLRFFIRQHPELVVSKDIHEQLQTFATNKDGKPEALPGNHDDGVLAFAHCYHMSFEETGVKVEVKEEVEKPTEWDTLDGLFEANNLELEWGEVDGY